MKHSQNPFPSILDKISYTKAVLDINLMDELRAIFQEKTKRVVSDAVILLALIDLHDAGYVCLEYIDPIDAVGRIHFISKVVQNVK